MTKLSIFFPDDRLNKFQYKREDEIRREADIRLKELKNREERIRQQAEEKLQLCRQREERVKQESELRLSQEHVRATTPFWFLMFDLWSVFFESIFK